MAWRDTFLLSIAYGVRRVQQYHVISFNIQTTSVILGLHSRAVGKFENLGVPAFFDEHNLSTLVERVN